MSGLLAASLGACSLVFDWDGLSEEAEAGGAAGALGGTGGAGQGGSAGFGAGGVGGGAGMGGASGGGAGGEGPVVSLDGCVLLLHMDEETWPNAGAVKDSSGLENNGTAVSGATTTPEGKFGGAGLFDREKGAYVDVPATAESLGGRMSAVTYAAWVYPTADPPTDGAGVISKRLKFEERVAFTLFFWLDAVYADIGNIDRVNSSKGLLTLHNWHHLAVVYDGALKAVRLYVDGTLAVLQSTSIGAIEADYETSVLIGSLSGNGDKFTGRIDEVAIWKRALSEGEVVALSKATRPLLAPPRSTCLHSALRARRSKGECGGTNAAQNCQKPAKGPQSPAK